MIENPNPRNFYSEKEMVSRQEYIPKAKQNLLNKLKDLIDKIENEEPFPHGNMSLDDLGRIEENIDDALNFWYY
jgi:hypothetical protein